MEEEGEKPKAKAEDSEEKPPKSPWAELLRSAAEKVATAVLTAGGLVAFVAVAGSVVLWTRFYALEVPQDQVVAAVPRSEAIAVGAAMLLLFGFLGALAALAVYLIDRGGRATSGMSRGLLLIVAVESLIAIWLAEGEPSADKLLASEVLILALAAIFLAMSIGELIRLKEDLRDYEEDEETQPERNRALRLSSGKSGISRTEAIFVAGAALGVGAVVWLLPLAAGVDRSSTRTWIHVLGAVGLYVLIVVTLNWGWFEFRERKQLDEDDEDERKKETKKKREDERKAEEKTAREKRAARLRARLTETVLGGWTASWERKRDGSSVSVSLSPADDRHKASTGEGKAKPGRRKKPHRIELAPAGIVVVGLLALAMVAIPAAILWEWWLAASLGTVVVLGVGLWRIAELVKERFIWYGLSVFLSVPLFGTMLLATRNLENPQVQPVALIRKSDGPAEAIQGIYVTETSKRVYFANIATEGCSNEIVPDSGRLLWVPRGEVVAMSIGPLQDVEDAANSALEMSSALTPDVETRNGDHVSLAVAAKKSSDGGEPTEEQLDKRLESPGPAVRPEFGKGLRLIPERVAPGAVVTLRMSQPRRVGDEMGFGSAREGRSLRLGGVELDILKEPAKAAEEAEYAEAEDGILLKLQKRVVYTKVNDSYRLLTEVSPGVGEGRFVKLEDSSVVAVGDSTEPFLEVDSQGHLLTREVTLKGDEEPVSLQPALLRQAWYENHIRFIVPHNASTGVVTVECGQLAGQPLLRVARPPAARLSVRMVGGSTLVSLDSSRSKGEAGEKLARSWTVAGRRLSGRTKVTAVLPPRFGIYSVRLTVTDSEGQTDTVKLRLLRVPASPFRFDRVVPKNLMAVERTQAAIVAAAREARPTAIVLHGHTDAVGSGTYNLELSEHRVENLRDLLLTDAAARAASIAPPAIPVTARAFGETCPIVRTSHQEEANRRVEIFLLGQGASIATAKGCRAGRTEYTSWQRP
jgi:hypothetical protein